MIVSFVLIAFNSDYVLEPCLRSVLPFGQVYCAEGPVKFWHDKGFATSTDRTNTILERQHIPIVHGQWEEKLEEANAALSLVPKDTDFVFCLDSDEIWNYSTLIEIFKALKVGQVDSMSFKAISFFGGFDRYMTGFEENFEVHRIMRYTKDQQFTAHRPPTINAPDGLPWQLHKHMNHEKTAAMGWRFYHYSYVFPSQMEAKSQYYETMGGTIPNYFDRVYLPWVAGDSEEKYRIEEQFDGVHNWDPKRRGPCRTKQFEGRHPEEIERVLPELRRRLAFEMGKE